MMARNFETVFDYNDLTIIQITLVLAQQNYKKKSPEWRRIESILKKLKENQCGSDRRLH
jgi:hypothetical protein